MAAKMAEDGGESGQHLQETVYTSALKN